MTPETTQQLNVNITEHKTLETAELQVQLTLSNASANKTPSQTITGQP